MKVKLPILKEILTINKDIAVLINKMQRQSGHLDSVDMTKLKDMQLKMKFHCRTHQEEWKLFQARNLQTNQIDGVSLDSI